MSSDLVNVCIFPIPGSAVLPFQTIQLHVFEPRYRQMIKYCVENDALVGVSLGVRALSGEKPAFSQVGEVEELQRNQQSYEPAKILSAGKVRILEEFEDGRMMVESTTCLRVRIQSMVQDIPYMIAECQMLPVAGLDPDRWSQIYLRMKDLLGDHFATLEKELLSKSDSQDIKFFHLLSRFQWPAEDIQQFLEIESLDAMADSLLKTLKGVELVTSSESPLH